MVQAPRSSPTNHIHDLCEVCKEKQASVVCLSCSLLGFKFCEECDNAEHNRAFRPVQLHRRIPIDEVDLSVSCTNHREELAVQFSESLNQFACQDCMQMSDWSQREASFQPLKKAAFRLREMTGRYHHMCRKAIAGLSETHRQLDNSLVQLTESVGVARASIQQEFTKLIQTLQQRQQQMMSIADKEVSWWRLTHTNACKSSCKCINNETSE